LTVSGGLLEIQGDTGGGLFVGTNAFATASAVLEGGVVRLRRLNVGDGGVLSNRSGGFLQFMGLDTVLGSGAKIVDGGTLSYQGYGALNVTGAVAKFSVVSGSGLQLDGSTNVNITGVYQLADAPGSFKLLSLSGANPLWRSDALDVGAGTTLEVTNAVNASVSSLVTNSGSVRVIDSTVSYLNDFVFNGGTLTTVNSTNNFTKGSTVASGSSLVFANGNSVWGGALTNSGTITVVNSQVRYLGAVVLQGGYVSDPSTNVFATNVTVTSSGYLAGGTGDVFAFERDLVNLSTQSNAFNLVDSAVVFTNGAGAHLFETHGLDLGSSFLSIAQQSNNFGIGMLQLAAGDMLRVTGAVGNALYVGGLDLASLANTNNFVLDINVYYDATRAENLYLGGGTYVLGAGSLIPYAIAIPEPSPLSISVAGLALLAFLRRQRA
jgi:hypothetical protein